MEKICIVKRRREYAQTEVKLTRPDNFRNTPSPEVAVSGTAIENRLEFTSKKILSDTPPTEVAVSGTVIENRLEFPAKKTESDTPPIEIAVSGTAIENHLEFTSKKTVDAFLDNSSPVISITMTQEQSALLQQSEYIKELLGGIKNDPSLDIKINADGQLALNFRFNDSLMLRMLCPDQVCQMLQVSRSFLQKLVNENKLNSYKLGRLRRFMLEDILEYLSSDEEFAQLKKEH